MKIFAKKESMETFFENLEIKIQAALKADMEHLKKEMGDEQPYAAALVTDSDCITLFLAVNTYEVMKKKDQESFEHFEEMLREHLSAEKLAMVKDGRQSITQWDYEEWGYSCGKESQFVPISKLLFNKESSDSQTYEQYQDMFFKTIASAFKKAIDAGVFGEHSDAMTFFVSISDDERTPEIEDKSAAYLNRKSVYEQFKNRPDLFD